MSICARRYTLIELLVTIIIIAILTTLLISVMDLSKRKSQEMQCKNNQKQLLAGVFGFSDDNSGWLPIMGAENFSKPWGTAYYHEIAPYCGYEGQVLPLPEPNEVTLPATVFHTETKFRKLDADNAEAPDLLHCPTQESLYRMSYNWNTSGFGFLVDAEEPNQRRKHLTSHAQVNNRKKDKIPSEVFVIGENEEQNARDGGGSGSIRASYMKSQWLGERHDGDINLIFFDGHSETRNKHYMILPNIDKKTWAALWFGNGDLY